MMSCRTVDGTFVPNKRKAAEVFEQALVKGETTNGEKNPGVAAGESYQATEDIFQGARSG